MADEPSTTRPPAFFEDLQRLPPGRHSVPTAEVARQQRERLMAGMLDAVGEQGYVATSVADVLARAGVSRRTFYEHFSDKEDCFLQAYDHVVAIAADAVRDVIAAQPDWRRAVRAGLALLLDTVAAHPRFARACIVEVLAVGPEGMRHRDAATQPFQRFFESGRDQAGAEWQLPATVAEILVGGILETITTRVMRNEADQVPALLDDLVYWALVPFIGPAAAAEAIGRSAGVSVS
ncbi:MAG TPA: TetR/AcrR family transcriptional regulator [Capillimicrobium sp.]|jgi:AcrR family transcriptional regulator